MTCIVRRIMSLSAFHEKGLVPSLQNTSRVAAPTWNLVISNVPGPREPLYCAGAQLQANFPVSVVIDGVGLNMTVMSYRDHVDFGIITDRDQVDDAWALMDRTAAALDELETAVCGKRATAAKGRRPSARTPA